MLIGGVSCSSYAAHHIAEMFKRVRAQRPFPDDSLQWKHITEQKLDKYRDAIDLFFGFNSEQKLTSPAS